MPKQNDYTLIEEELKQVLEALKTPVTRVAEPALVLQDYPPQKLRECKI
jgi:hypothetical protein